MDSLQLFGQNKYPRYLKTKCPIVLWPLPFLPLWPWFWWVGLSSKIWVLFIAVPRFHIRRQFTPFFRACVELTLMLISHDQCWLLPLPTSIQKEWIKSVCLMLGLDSLDMVPKWEKKAKWRSLDLRCLRKVGQRKREVVWWRCDTQGCSARWPFIQHHGLRTTHLLEEICHEKT